MSHTKDGHSLWTLIMMLTRLVLRFKSKISSLVTFLTRKLTMAISPSSQGNIYIEEYIHSYDVYRTTTAQPFLPWPVITSPPAADLMDKWEQVKPHVLSLLGSIVHKHLGLRSHQWNASLLLFSKPGYAKNTDIASPTMCVNISSSSSSNAHGTWTTARNEIKLLLDSVELNVNVDIVNPRRVYQPSLFGIASTDQMIKLYSDSIRNEMLQVIKLRLDDVWEFMSILRVGNSIREAEYAVVILIKPFSKCNWIEVRDQLLKIIHSRTCHDASMARLTVKFLPGEWQYGSPRQDSTLNFKEVSKKKSKIPSLGDSIGILNEAGGGSLGGFITLQVDKKLHKCFLTNWHVTRPLTQLPRAFKKQAERWSSNYFQKNDPIKTTLQYFAKSDCIAVKDWLDHEDNELHKELDELEKEEKPKRLCGKTESLGSQLRKANVSEAIHTNQNLQRIFDSMPYEIGKILVSSGQRVNFNPNHDGTKIMDWAVVEINPNHAQLYGKNVLPKFRTTDASAWSFQIEAGERPFIPTRFSSMITDRQYFKVGRTSGYTKGTCHGIRVDIPGKHLRYDEKGHTILVRDPKVSTQEWIVPATQKGRSRHDKGFDEYEGDFCALGDSGSFVIDPWKGVAGLLYGQVTNWCGPDSMASWGGFAGLISSMDDVIKDIQQKTTRKTTSGIVALSL